jgi:hypothetical protein
VIFGHAFRTTTNGFAENILNSTEFQGFPIVQDRNSKLLIGYINRTELKYGIGSLPSSYIHVYGQAPKTLNRHY